MYINGGVVVSYSSEEFGNYSVFTPYGSGQSIAFDGVNVSENSFDSTSAYQFNGEIYIGSGFDTFDVCMLAHEYGHYMQQVEMGSLGYLTDVAIPSFWSAMTDPANHMSQSFEVEATRLGETYAFGSY